MIIWTPADAVLFATKKTDYLTNDGTPIVMRQRRDTTQFFYKNRNAEPDDETYAEAAEFLRDITEVEISAEQAKAILALYPHPRIKIAEFGVSDTDCQDELCFAAAHFFLGCDWPKFGDKVDIVLFMDCLKAEAVRMGFSIPKASA